MSRHIGGLLNVLLDAVIHINASRLHRAQRITEYVYTPHAMPLNIHIIIMRHVSIARYGSQLYIYMLQNIQIMRRVSIARYGLSAAHHSLNITSFACKSDTLRAPLPAFITPTPLRQASRTIDESKLLLSSVATNSAVIPSVIGLQITSPIENKFFVC